MLAVDASKAVASINAAERRLRAMADELGASFTCTISLPEAEERKLTYFDGGTTRQPKRHVFALTPGARAAIVDAVRERFMAAMLRAETPSMLPVMTVAANAFRRVWVQRLETSGGDSNWAALSPRYAAWKRRKGLDPRIGVARNRMLAAVKRGQVIVRKTR